MMFMWIIPLVVLYLLLDRTERRQDSRKWVLVGLAVLALPMLGMGFMGGHMGQFGGMMGGYGGMMGGYGGMMGRYGGMMGRYGGWGWSGMAMGLVMLLVLGGLAFMLLRKKETTAGTEPEELQILKLRLARGEITTEEYDLLRQKLNG